MLLRARRGKLPRPTCRPLRRTLRICFCLRVVRFDLTVSIAEKFVRIRNGKDVGATHRLLRTVAEGAVLFTVASWAFDLVIALLAPRAFEHGSSSYSQIVVMLMAVLVPDGLAAW